MKQLIFVSLVAAISTNAFAKEDWTACKTTEDCGIAEDPCGKARPLNKKFLLRAEKANGGFQPLIACPEGAASEAKLFEAVCKEKKCVLEKKAEEHPAEAGDRS